MQISVFKYFMKASPYLDKILLSIIIYNMHTQIPGCTDRLRDKRGKGLNQNKNNPEIISINILSIIQNLHASLCFSFPDP